MSTEPLIKDSRWVRQSFLVRSVDLERVDQQNRVFSSVSLKYTDTTPGGNIPINPPPQFTRYADLRSSGRFFGNQTQGQSGMGRYYSEAIDDNGQIIHMRFGVPQFTSMSKFFTNFYNTGAGQLARTGRAPTAFYYLGRAAGFVVSVMSWKIVAVSLVGAGWRFMFNNDSTKFYYLKPAMPLYWNAVTTMVNQLAVNRGIIPRIGDSKTAQINGNPQGGPQAIAQLNALLPEIFKKNGGIDVYALANRAQRLARKHYKNLERALAQNDIATREQLYKRMQQDYSAPLHDTVPEFNSPTSSEGENNSYLGRWLRSSVSKPPVSDGEKTFDSEKSVSEDKSALQSFGEFLEAELDEGGAFVSFRVNATGTSQESFSNQTGESDLAGMINGKSSAARSARFNISGGNIGDGVIASTVEKALGAAKDVVTGVMDSFEVSGLAALAGAALVDIPKHWQSSSATLPRASYTITLTSPYGNPMSQLLNIYIPLCMLLAGALPLSTGRQSYTSPFLLELFDQGRCQSRLAIVESLSVARGGGNLGYTNEGHAMRVDVSFTVMDLSTIMHMPISQNFEMGTGAAVGAIVGGVTGTVAGPAGTVLGAGLGAAAGTVVDSAAKLVQTAFGSDTVFSDYMATLSGMGLNDQIYQFQKLKLNVTRAAANWDSFTSGSRFASFVGDSLPGRLASLFYTGTVRDRVDLSTVR